MIRYVHIGSQILSDRNQFALYDTVTDQFLTFLGSDTFDSAEDLDESMNLDDVGAEMRERCLSLCRHHDNPRPDDIVMDDIVDYDSLTDAEKAMLRKTPLYDRAKELGLVPPLTPTYADLVALIRQAEWSGFDINYDTDTYYPSCPWCDEHSTDGHAKDCPAARVLYPEERS